MVNFCLPEFSVRFGAILDVITCLIKKECFILWSLCQYLYFILCFTEIIITSHFIRTQHVKHGFHEALMYYQLFNKH